MVNLQQGNFLEMSHMGLHGPMWVKASSACIRVGYVVVIWAHGTINTYAL